MQVGNLQYGRVALCATVAGAHLTFMQKSGAEPPQSKTWRTFHNYSFSSVAFEHARRLQTTEMRPRGRGPISGSICGGEKGVMVAAKVMVPQLPRRATDSSDSGEGRSQWFTTTHWSVVRAAAEVDSTRSTEALENLCSTYWYPLYAYVRRRGQDAEGAKELTQEFFARLLAKGLLAGVDPTKGRFRSWLLGVMNHFLAHEWARVRAQKRGGGQPAFSLDEMKAEERYRLEPIEE